MRVILQLQEITIQEHKDENNFMIQLSATEVKVREQIIGLVHKMSMPLLCLIGSD